MAEYINGQGASRAVGREPIVQNSQGKLEAPEHTITSISAARGIYHRLRDQHLERIALYSSIKGLIAGNPPYDQDELDQNGLDHIANFNDLSANSTFERAALAYWSLINQTETLVKFSLNFPGEPNAQKFAEIMGLHWNYVVRQWPAFESRVNRLSSQLVELGISPVIWSDERDWRWRVVDIEKFLVPDQAQDDLDLLTFFCVESTFDVQFLWQVYNKFKDTPKEDTPWCIEEVANLLLKFANQWQKSQNNHFTNLIEVQSAIQNGDIGFGEYLTDSIRIVSLIQKEYEGEFSHYMFHTYTDGGDFLYYAGNLFDKLDDLLVLFTATPGARTIHSNKGVGHKMFSAQQTMMQLNCSMVDMAKISSTPFLRGAPTQDINSLKFFPGVPTHIGSSEFVQTNFGANIGQLIGASDFINNRMETNIANAGDNPGLPDSHKQGSIAPSNARMMAYREHGILKNNIAHFYNKFDFVVRNMVKKMLESRKGDPGHEYVEEWKFRCLRDGVPPELFERTKTADINLLTGLPRWLDVRASRVAGDGSTLGRIMGLQELAELLGGNIGGPREIKAFRRQVVLATQGPDYLDEYMQESAEADERAGGASLAALENAIMQDGKAPVFSLDNEHRSHLATHIALGTEIIQLIQDGQMDATQADRVFHTLVPHMMEHFQTAAQSPFNQQFVGQVQQAVRQIEQYATLNRRNAMAQLKAQAQKQEQAEQAQSEAMSEQQRKDWVAQTEQERAERALAAKEQRTAEAQSTRGEIMKEKVYADAANERLRIQLEAQNKQNKTAKEMSLQEAKANIRRISGNTPSPADIERN